MTVTGKPQKRAVGVFSSRDNAESALRELKDSGFPMSKVSIIVQDGNQHSSVIRDYSSDRVGEGAATGAVAGGALGGITGLLVGLGALAIPGVGPILLIGAEATVIATMLAGGAIGAAAGGLLGALIGLGIPEERAKVYTERVSLGDYLVMVNGTEKEILRAQAILHNRGIEEWGVYESPEVQPIPTATPQTPKTEDRATRKLIESGDYTVVSDKPEVIIRDRRNSIS